MSVSEEEKSLEMLANTPTQHYYMRIYKIEPKEQGEEMTFHITDTYMEYDDVRDFQFSPDLKANVLIEVPGAGDEDKKKKIDAQLAFFSHVFNSQASQQLMQYFANKVDAEALVGPANRYWHTGANIAIEFIDVADTNAKFGLVCRVFSSDKSKLIENIKKGMF